LLYEI